MPESESTAENVDEPTQPTEATEVTEATEEETQEWAAPDAPTEVAMPVATPVTTQVETPQATIPVPAAPADQAPTEVTATQQGSVTQPTFPPPGFVPQQGYPQQGYPQTGYPQPQAAAYGNPYGQQFPYAPATDQPAAKGKRKRVLWIVGAAVVVLGLIGAGIYVLLPGRTGDSVVTAVTCQPSDLTTCLIKSPAGAVQLSASSGDQWPQQTVSTAGLYSSNITNDSTGMNTDTEALLSQDGLKTVVHRDWNAVDGNNIDIVLLAFNSQKGANEWNSTRAGEIFAAYPGTTVAIPGDSTGKAHAATKADSKGNVNAAYSIVVGRMVLNVSYSSPTKLSAQDLQNWAGTELTSLRTAPAPATDPADAAPSTQQVACGGGIQSCLMAMPGDGQTWTSPTNSHWVSSSSLTPSQYVHLFWDSEPSSVQQTVLSHFTDDGVTGIAHEDWTTNNGNDQADVYLIQTMTAAGANELTTTNFGEPKWNSGMSGISYTIPNRAGSQAWYGNKTDSGGFTDFAYTSTVGNVIVMSWLYFYGSFDSATAKSWAEPQLDRVSSSVQTQPMGLFSLNAPSLPAASQGSCGSSGCLLPLPSGASDTTSSSYSAQTSIPASAYLGQYELTDSQEMAQWLATDGFVSADHRSWTASGGVTADAALLKYGTPAQAEAAARLEFGVNAASDRICTDSAVPDSLCLATPVNPSDYLQKETVWVLAWKGDYEVGVSVTVSDSADLTQAYTWARQQLDMLPASS